MNTPDSSEYAPYYGRYVQLVSEPDIVGVLDEVGLTPWNIPERISRNKAVEELLDLLGESGRAGLEEAARLAKDFFGPILRNVEEENGDLDSRLQELLVSARRRG